MKEKKNVLFKNLDLVFVYLFIFLVGTAIALGMISYLNKQVQEIDNYQTTTNLDY